MTTPHHQHQYPHQHQANSSAPYASRTPEPHLRDTIVSHPHLLDSSSRHSITASEDFYSLSEGGREEEQATTPRQYPVQTYPEFSHLQEHVDPVLRIPNRNITPVNDSKVSQDVEEFITPPSRVNSASIENANQPANTPANASSTHPSPAFHNHIKRKPISSISSRPTEPSLSPVRNSVVKAGNEANVSRQVTVIHKRRDDVDPTLTLDKMEGRDLVARTATPGADDMPFIRFAIDQLTRDEEVHGNRPYASQQPARAPSRSAVPPSAPRTTRPSQPVPAHSFDRQTQYPNEPYKVPLAEQSRRRSTLPNIAPLPQATLPSDKAMWEDESPAPIAHYDVFMPYEHGSSTSVRKLASLTALPTILQPVWLGIYICLCLLMLTALIFCGAWSQKHSGLWPYVAFGDNRYFTFHYLPAIFGMVILLWLLQIQIAVQRIAPFMAMASASTTARSQAALMDLYPTQFLYPKRQYFQSRQWVLSGFHVACWVFLLTIPLLSASFNVRYTNDGDEAEWRWVTVQGAIWTVVTLYIIVVIALIVLFVYLRRNHSGLKWDPRSLADIIALLERANIMSDYAESEIFASRGQFSQRLWTRSDRLGYWHTSRRPQNVFHGIGAEGAAARRYSLEQGQLREKTIFGHSRENSTFSEHSDDRSDDERDVRRDLRDPFVLARHTPWMLTTVALLAFSFIAIALFIAFLTLSFVDRATITGFFPSVRATADIDGFSPANFLFAFLPGLLGLLCFLLWQPMDLAIRRMAMFSSLSKAEGATPAKSLLLEYPALSSIPCVTRALLNRDWLVAFSASISLLSAVIPILAGGVFWAQYYPSNSEVKVSAEQAGWYALWVFLAIGAVAYPVLLVVALARRGLVPALPHQALCLAELLSWLYMSPVITDPLFARVNTRAELIARLAAANNGSRYTARNVPSQQPLVPHNQHSANHDDTAPRLTVRLLGDHSSSQSDGFSAPHNRIPGRVSSSSRNSVSNNSLNMTEPLPRLVRPSGPIRFAFGIYIGRDGREHLGIDRFVRDGREMVVMDDAIASRKISWLWR